MSKDAIMETIIGPMPIDPDDSTLNNDKDTSSQDKNKKKDDMDTNEPSSAIDTNDIDTELDLALDNHLRAMDHQIQDDEDEEDDYDQSDTPSPPALFFLSQIGNKLDHLEYDQRILHIANTNIVDMSWQDLKTLIKDTFSKQCTAFEQGISDTDVLSAVNGIKTNIYHCIDHHSGIPFTIQRLCELISEPTRHYEYFIKYLHAIEKVLSVASTLDSFSEDDPSHTNGSTEQLDHMLHLGYEVTLPTYTPISTEDQKDDDKDTIDNEQSQSNGILHDNNTEEKNDVDMDTQDDEATVTDSS
ncbi:PPP4R2-domain-containing protein [Halteromyces radiatus]|uniref:PPP4R2-domain-containing protein n=1 Tax=Halteromyces radiatus TaxID=101107 RepID=UPI00221F5DB4|nr:PPP4R2-domain-containing protein [Halteromyces radiatus]KAI8079926.1 PPP4R2-domain-containing protein [Halteromyces radiatus]